MSPPRDPLSVRYDGVVWGVLNRAARASVHKAGVRVWIASPRAEFRARDRGGRTAHERAFTRAAYYKVWREPINEQRIPDWSLQLTWGDDVDRKPSSRGRLARPVLVRLRPRSLARVGADEWWRDHPELRSLYVDGGRGVGGCGG